jgi:Kdo2-lipid IVA lauroyltransferase/acyltransferase
MLKPRSRAFDYSAYLLVRIFSCWLLMLPIEWAAGLVCFLSRIGYWVARSKRKIAIENLEHAFLERYSPKQMRSLARGVFEHFGSMLLEMLLIPRKLHRRSWPRLITMADAEGDRRVFGSGRPVLIVTAHYGNWELASYWPGFLGVKGHIVVRPMENPYVERQIKKFRERSGATVLSKNGDAGEMLSVLSKGGVVCTIGDQNAGPRGLFVDFFGRPASTHKAIAVLALRTRALMYVGGLRNTGGLLRYTVHPIDLIDTQAYAGKPDAVAAVTQRMTAALERLVRLDPRQYLWLHRRWKHQPPAAAAALPDAAAA